MAHRLIAAALALALLATPAHADPIITPIVLAILGPELAGTALLTIGGFSLTVGALVTSLVTVGVGLALTLLFAPAKPRIPPPENGVVAVQQNMPYRIKAIGRCRVAGAIMLKEEVASHLVYVSALVAHYTDAIERLFLNDDQVTVDTVGGRLVGWVQPGTDGRYGTQVIAIDTRQGLPTETFYDGIANLLPSEWTDQHRGDGQSSLSMQLQPVRSEDFSTVFPYYAPSPSVIGRWSLLYDPRDPSQDRSDSRTWKWSQNAALAIIDHLCFSDFGFRSDYAVAIAPYLDFWIQAANDCDELVPLKAGGTEARYHVGGWFTAEQARVTTLMAMLASCDGFLSRRGAGYVLWVGKYYEPTVTITDDDIAGWSLQSDQASEDRANEIIASYTSPDNGYISVDTDPMVDAVDQLARAGAPRKASLQLTWVQSTGQASRLQKIEFNRQSIGKRGTLILHWSGMNAAYERFVRVASNSIPGLSGAVIEVRKSTDRPKQRLCEIDFVISGPSIFAYDPSIDESAPPTIPQRPESVSLPIPSNLTAIGTLLTDSGGNSSTILELAWDEAFYNGNPWVLDYYVQWRLHDTGGGQPGGWTQQKFTSPAIVANRVSVNAGVVPEGVDLDTEVASVGTGATLSTWSNVVTISTRPADVAPYPPSWNSATGGTGSAALSVTASLSTNCDAIQFYRALHNQTFASAIAIGSAIATAPGATATYTDTVAAGSYDYFAVELTTSLIASLPAGPQNAVVS